MNTAILCVLSIALISIPSAESAAYCTYHNYNSWDSLTTVACSDGINGIMTKFGYSNLGPMFPWVTAYSGATWNSPNCGQCVQLSSGGRSVYLTVVDQCGPPPGGFDAHFDIAPDAFRQLFGDVGFTAGVQAADWQVVASSNCRGNLGNTGNVQPPPPAVNPPPVVVNPPPSRTVSSTRCGWNWGDANGKCGTPCVDNDGPCGAEKCFADLSTGPCGVNPATEDEVTSFSEDEVTSFSEDGTSVEITGEFTDAAIADTSFETEEGSFVADVSMNTESTDNFVDSAVADTAEEEYVDNYVDMAMADVELADAAALTESFETDDSNFVDQNVADYAVAGEGASQQQSSTTTSSGMQGWMVGILVLFSMTTLLLLAVIVLSVSVLRKQK